MRKAFVHIGMPKTGTSAIQAAMSASQSMLGQNGLLYPGHHDDHVRLLPRFHQLGADHFYFAHKGVSPLNAEQQGKGFLRVLENDATAFQGNLLLSSEYLFDLKRDHVARLNTYLQELGFQMHVICYLRHPVAMATSSIQQDIKMAHRYLSDHLIDPQWHSMQDTLEPYLQVLGKGRLILRVFETVKHCGTEQDILGAVGYLGDPSQIVAVRKNRSLSMTATLLIDALNRQARDNSDVNWSVHSSIKTILMKIGGSRFFLPEKTQAIIRDRAQAELEWLKQTFQIELFEPNTKPTAFAGLSRESADDLIRAMSGLAHPFPSEDIGVRTDVDRHASTS